MAVSHKTAWKFLPVKASGTALIIVKLWRPLKIYYLNVLLNS